MKAAIFEYDLMWSRRLTLGLHAMGWEAVVVQTGSAELAVGCAAAIVNLGSSRYDPETLISGLMSNGIWVVAHAGHKEKERLDAGRSFGADRIATNSELTHKLASVLAECPAVSTA